MSNTNARPTKQHTHRLPQLSPQMQLENAVDKACALLEMFAQKLAEEREKDGAFNSGKYAAGICNLACDTERELFDAYLASFEEYAGLRETLQKGGAK